MTFFTTKHTMASIDIIKSQLSKILKWLSIIVSIIFVAYYAYLIYINLDSVFYIVAYSVLLAASVSAFICEIALSRPNKYDSKLVKKIKTKHKKTASLVINIVKYCAKLFTIGLALYEVIRYDHSRMEIISLIGSTLFLGIQIIFEFVIHLVNKYIDYIRLGVELDMSDSGIVQALNYKKTLSKTADRLEGIEIYSEDEKEIIANIKAEVKINEEINKAELENNKGRIINAVKVNLFGNKKADEKATKKEYERCKVEAVDVINGSKVDAVLLKTKDYLDNSSLDPKDVKSISDLASLAYNFVKGVYTIVPVKSIVSIVALLIYLVSPVHKAISKVPFAGVVDKKIMTSLCLAEVQSDLEKFLKWQEDR